jgi:hypothetical protein
LSAAGFYWRGFERKQVVAPSQIVDVSGGFPGKPGMISNWAIKDKEVLIMNYVLPEAITPIK